VHYRSAADVKAARAWLLEQQARPFEILDSEAKREKCRLLLSYFGRQVRLPEAREVKQALMTLTPDSLRLPEAEARRVLNGTEVLRSSAPASAPLRQHLESLRQAAFKRTCYDGKSGLGNPFTGLMRRVQLMLPETSGLLDGAVFWDQRGASEIIVQDNCHAIVFVVAELKRQVLQPLTGALAASGVSSHWIHDFRTWRAAAGAAEVQAGAAGGVPAAEEQIQEDLPFTFPVLHVMVTADKAHLSDRDALLSVQRSCPGDLAVHEFLLGDFRQRVDPASLVADIEKALMVAGRGEVSEQEVSEIVRRQVGVAEHSLFQP
jgi:hypothetical protein